MESTEIAVIELPEQVRVLAQNSGLPAEESKALAIGFNVFFTDLEALKLRIETEINLDDPGPEDEKKAGEFRKLLKKQRTTANQYRELANEKVLAVQRLNNGIFKLVEDNTKPLEDHLSKIENAARIKEEARLTKLEADRKEALSPFELDTTFYDLKNMPEDKWEAFYNAQKTAYEAVKQQKEQQEKENTLRETRMQIINDRNHYEYPNVDYGKISDNEFDAILKNLDEAKAEQARKLNLHNEREAALREYGYTDESTFLGNMDEEPYQVLVSEWKARKEKADQDALAQIQLENAQRAERIRLRELSDLGVHYPPINQHGDESQPLGELSEEEYLAVKEQLVAEKKRGDLMAERQRELLQYQKMVPLSELFDMPEDQYAKLLTEAKDADEERKDKEAKSQLQEERLKELLPFNGYGEEIDMTTLWVYTDWRWKEIMDAKKDAYEDHHDKIAESRMAELAKLGSDLAPVGLGYLSESEWQGVLLQAQSEFEEKQSQAPDKDKLVKFKADLAGLKVPDLTSVKGVKAKDFILERIQKLTESIDSMLSKM